MSERKHWVQRHFRLSLEATDKPPDNPTENQRLAWRLRQMADQLDGGQSFRLAFDFDPELTSAQVSRCLACGFDRARALLEEEMRHTALEEAMREARPDLYTDDSGTAGPDAGVHS